MVACVRVVGSQYPWSFLQGSPIPWQRIVWSFKSRVSCTFSSCIFQSKTLSLGILYFLCLLCNLRDHFFLCVISNVYHEDRMLIIRVLHERRILYLVLCDFGVFQVLLDVLHLGELENLQVFCLCFRLVISLVALVRFYSHGG